MNEKEITQTRDRVSGLLDRGRLAEAFVAVQPLVAATSDWTVRDHVEQLQMSYNLMLQYLSQGVVDPQRRQVLVGITEALYTTADRCAIALLEPSGHEVFFARRRELGDTALAGLMQDYRAELNKHRLLNGVPAGARDDKAIDTVLQQSELLETAIFNKIWCTFPLSDEEERQVAQFVADGDVPEHARGLAVSALLLGLLRVYDERKVALLADAYRTAASPLVEVRAVVALLLALKIHNRRAAASATVASRIEAMLDSPGLTRDVGMAQFLLSRTRNTEALNRRVQQDLMPDIMKMRPGLLKKLRDMDGDGDPEANPEWQRLLDDSGITRKMEEFSEMQLEGNDVYVATFSRLKSFPFFQTLSNWFLPFHSGNSAVRGTFAAGEAPLRLLVERAPFLCDSDRYSFGLSLGAVPASQRRLMLAQIGEHATDLDEQARNELPDPQHERERLTNSYAQDLYRFFHLFSRRHEFIAAFDGDMDFTTVPHLGRVAGEPRSVELVAEYYFKNDFHTDAIKFYKLLLQVSRDADPHIYQKLGFCHQALGDVDEALRQYERYELADDSDLWTIKHLANCHRALKHYDRAMACYRRVEELQPGTLGNTLNMGHCLLEQGLTEEALQHYYRADLALGGKQRAWRPVAWCLFLLGNDERSLDYCDRIVAEGKPTEQDHLNRGHVLLAMGRNADALASYRRALDAYGGNADALRAAVEADADALASRGIARDDLPIIIDAVTHIKP